MQRPDFCSKEGPPEVPGPGFSSRVVPVRSWGQASAADGRKGLKTVRRVFTFCCFYGASMSGRRSPAIGKLTGARV
eukprot:3055213-Pyramimonas_sp.AAC.1